MRIEVEWDKPGVKNSLRHGDPSSASVAGGGAAGSEVPAGGEAPSTTGGGTASVWDLAVEGTADDFELPPAL